jgi:hypothetical protein
MVFVAIAAPQRATHSIGSMTPSTTPESTGTPEEIASAVAWLCSEGRPS